MTVKILDIKNKPRATRNVWYWMYFTLRKNTQPIKSPCAGENIRRGGRDFA
jgi:hypothetical protein